MTKTYECKTCEVKITGPIKQWEDHLASAAHRKMTSIRPGGGLKAWDYKRGIILRNLSEVFKQDILNWVREWGEIADFIYLYEKDGTSEVAHVLFTSE